MAFPTPSQKTDPEDTSSKPGGSNESTTQSGSKSICALKSIAAKLETPLNQPLVGLDVLLTDDTGNTLDTQKSGEFGIANFGQRPPGKYRVRAQKPLFVNSEGEPVAEARFDHGDINDTLERLVLVPVEAHLFLDADRNGNLTRQELTKWDTIKGAIILTNCNSSTPQKIVRLDGIAPLEVRLTPTNAKEVKAKISLIKTDPERIWIYPECSVGKECVVGGFKGKTAYEWTLTSQNGKLGMAAGRFDLMASPSAAEAEILIQLDVSHQGELQKPEQGLVRVAPWMIPSPLLPAEVVYAAPWRGRGDNPLGDNGKFRAKLKENLGQITFDETTLDHENDRWAQDCCEFGYSCSNQEILAVVLRAPRQQMTLAAKVKDLRGEKVGVVESVTQAVSKSIFSDLDKFGNLEVTPPCKGYPFGRIYYGGGGTKTPLDETIRSMLHAQRFQSPFQIDTSFLDVGHVDEVISFVPCGEKWKICLADPWLGRQLLLLASAVDPNEKMMEGIWRKPVDEFVKCDITVDKFLKDQSYEKVHNIAMKGMITIWEQLQKEIGLTGDQVISIPVVYCAGRMGGAAAFTGNMVNMLVLEKTCVMITPCGPAFKYPSLHEQLALEQNANANFKNRWSSLVKHPLAPWLKKPSGPPQFAQDLGLLEKMENPPLCLDLFRHYTELVLKKEGLSPVFLPSAWVYQGEGGTVHCGTNTKRRVQQVEWWKEKLPAALPLKK